MRYSKLVYIPACIILAVSIVIGGFLVFFNGFTSTNYGCGINSDTYKKQQSKMESLNKITLLPGQSTKLDEIVDNTSGTCNLDVAQSYTATKAVTVEMDAVTAVASVTSSLEKEGFKVISSKLTEPNNCSDMFGTVSFRNESMVVVVTIATPKNCAKTSTVKITVSTPDEIVN